MVAFEDIVNELKILKQKIEIDSSVYLYECGEYIELLDNIISMVRSKQKTTAERLMELELQLLSDTETDEQF